MQMSWTVYIGQYKGDHICHVSLNFEFDQSFQSGSRAKTKNYQNMQISSLT